VISSWGERWGGENLTDFIVDRLLVLCEQKAPDRRVVIADRLSQQDEDERLNQLVLDDWAENWKVSASRNERFSTPLSLRVRRPDRQSESFAFSDLDEIGHPAQTLRDLYESELGNHIGKLANRLKEDLARLNIGLDVLQLSGKSSTIPQVQSILAETFGGDIIKPNPELKECVVRGACLWHQMQNSPSLRLKTPDSLQTTTSRLGIWDAGVERFREIIPLGWPIGQPGTPFLGYRWRASQETIELHENLGERDVEGDVQRLGSFRPENVDILKRDVTLTLNLLVAEDYWPHLTATAENGDLIKFQLTEEGES
jgi:hypothetical protein